MANIPPGNGKPVSFSDYNLGEQVRRLWGPDFFRPDTGYMFSNGRRFDSSDQGRTGIYGQLPVTAGVGYDLQVSGTVVPPGTRPPYLLTESGLMLRIT